MNNATKNKTKTTKIKATKKTKELKEPTAYQLFVKEKMPEVKNKFPLKERMLLTNYEKNNVYNIL